MGNCSAFRNIIILTLSFPACGDLSPANKFCTHFEPKQARKKSLA